MSHDNRTKTIQVVYDGECPICRFYCERVAIDDLHGHLELVDARQASSIRDDITARALDIDQGMVVKHDGNLYYAEAAIQHLANLGSRRDWFHRINRLLFKSKIMAKLFYPMGRSARNVVLKFMGKTKINNLGKKNNSRF